MKDHTSWIRREPIGVIGQVTPWNYPLIMAVWKFGPAIAAGNTVVLKPSDTTPRAPCCWPSWRRVPAAGTLNVITGDRETGRMLVSSTDAEMVAITGLGAGGHGGRGQAAAPRLKRVHLELGGKAPVVVFDDADIEAAVEGIAVAGYFNAGQDCTAATRVLVHPRVHDDFVAALAE
jgi:betaine-aldehyde dehydrogenase